MVWSIKLLPVQDIPDDREKYQRSNFNSRRRLNHRNYKNLPYIFVYDDHFRHLHTILFEGSDVRKLKPVGIPSEAFAE
ncbi:MAG: hypothetical protein OXE59_11615 [Bacteroidetes bacterium]|nr:hypothetical protein [Bacteroidota bacterium]